MTGNEKLDRYISPEPMSGCWLWTGTIKSNGYGDSYTRELGHENAHRAVYKFIRGQIPEKMCLDHLCRTRCCVNPSHLEPVTHKVNVNRGMGSQVTKEYLASRTHCKNGHELCESNVSLISEAGYIRRRCKECRRESGRRQWKARRGR